MSQMEANRAAPSANSSKSRPSLPDRFKERHVRLPFLCLPTPVASVSKKISIAENRKRKHNESLPYYQYQASPKQKAPFKVSAPNKAHSICIENLVIDGDSPPEAIFRVVLSGRSPLPSSNASERFGDFNLAF